MDDLAEKIIKGFDDSRHVHVNLDGVVNSIDELPGIIRRGRRGIGFQEYGPDGMIGNITNWEIMTILERYRGKATFYLNGTEVIVP